jgi:hypothetical protein
MRKGSKQRSSVSHKAAAAKRSKGTTDQQEGNGVTRFFKRMSGTHVTEPAPPLHSSEAGCAPGGHGHGRGLAHGSLSSLNGLNDVSGMDVRKEKKGRKDRSGFRYSLVVNPSLKMDDFKRFDPGSLHTTSVDIIISVIRGEGLAAKDRNFWGKATSSDPFVEVFYQGESKGRTRTINKSLSPVWNDTIRFTIFGSKKKFVKVRLKIMDDDMLSASDLMGVVVIPFSTGVSQPRFTSWYEVDPNSAVNAKGRIKVEIESTARKSMSLIRGNNLELNSTKIQAGLSWDSIHGAQVDLDLSCIGVSSRGRIHAKECIVSSFRFSIHFIV